MVPCVLVFSLVVCAQLISLSAHEFFRTDSVVANKLLKVRMPFSSFSLPIYDFFVWCVEDCVNMAVWVWRNPRLFRSLTTWYIQPSAPQITTALARSVQLRVNRSPLADVDSLSDVWHSEALLTKFDQTKNTNTFTMLSSGRWLSSFDWYPKA